MKTLIILMVTMISYTIYFLMALFETPIKAMERSSKFMNRFESKRYQ